MKSAITFAIMAIIVIAGLLAVYNPPEEKTIPVIEVKPVSQLTKPVILTPNEEMRRSAAIIALFADDGQPVDAAIRERQARAAARDNHLPVARSVYAAR